MAATWNAQSHNRPLAEGDPRWDKNGFEASCNEAQLAFAYVGWLRKLRREGSIYPWRRQDCPPGVLHIGAPPPDAQIFMVEQKWLDAPWARSTANKFTHPDPEGFNFPKLVAALDAEEAYDDDLVFIDILSWYMRPETEEERRLLELQHEMMPMTSCFCRLQFVVLPDVPKLCKASYFDTLLCLHYFNIATFTARIITQPYPKLEPTEAEKINQLPMHPEVAKHMTPEWLLGTVSKYHSFPVGGPGFSGWSPNDLIRSRHALGLRMPTACNDALGFQTVCQLVNIRWIKVSFVHELAARGGPAPRRQDLPPGVYIDGIVPDGRQPWVLTYGWASVSHFSPSGAKLKELSDTLNELDAKPTDVAFVDFMSLWQSARTVPELYATQNKLLDKLCNQQIMPRDGKVELPGLEKAQKKQAKAALYETTRLYAFAGGQLPSGEEVKGCKVIVLPNLENPHQFPASGEVKEELNTHCQPERLELNSDWGFAKSVPYHQGGWTCTEFAVALKNKTIANSHHKAVRKVMDARTWPDNVAQFAAMMDENAAVPVAFTKKGDRQWVRFNFYRYCYHLNEQQ